MPRECDSASSVWRKPSSGENPALEPEPALASSSSGGNPVKLEPEAVESDNADKPSSGGNPALGEAASSSSGGNPVTLEPAAVESNKADEDERGYNSEVTVHDSDESGASIFGLRRADRGR